MPTNKQMLETLLINNSSSYLDHLNKAIISFDLNNQSEIVKNSNTHRVLNE